MKFTDQEVIKFIHEAFEKASEAAREYLLDIGGDRYPCGFAWVRIKPARGQLVKNLKALEMGSTDEFEGGFVVYNPSRNACQNMYAKEVGARAFAKHLKDSGIEDRILVQSRMD